MRIIILNYVCIYVFPVTHNLGKSTLAQNIHTCETVYDSNRTGCAYTLILSILSCVPVVDPIVRAYPRTDETLVSVSISEVVFVGRR